VTLGTRVRIEILKAITKNCVGERNIMYVSAFLSRPMLHVKPKGGEGPRPVAYTFSDALSKYGENLRRDDLGDAYKRAGIAFKGQLQQNFVVLHDTGHHGHQSSNTTRAATSTGAGRGSSSSTRKPFLKRRLGNEKKMLGTPEKKKK
jgi:hypothetical protein